MNSSALNWQRIESFIGYGRRDAPLVFIGVEEGLADESALENDLRRRSQFEPIMDLREAHRGIADTDKWFGPQKIECQPTWRPMCDLLLRREGVSAPTPQDRNRYQAYRLGRSDGDTLLCELLPYPHKRSADPRKKWEYAQFGRHPTYESYRASVLPTRRECLRRLIAEAHRDLIICYGKGKDKRDWAEYQQLFRGAKWQARPPFRFAETGETRVVLTPHFSTKDFNTDQQLAAFAAVALKS